jgi:hypothetical protein
MQNQLMVAIFVAVGATLVAGLIAIPLIEQQQAAHADKGGVPNAKSAGHGRGHLKL